MFSEIFNRFVRKCGERDVPRHVGNAITAELLDEVLPRQRNAALWRVLFSSVVDHLFGDRQRRARFAIGWNENLLARKEITVFDCVNTTTNWNRNGDGGLYRRWCDRRPCGMAEVVTADSRHRTRYAGRYRPKSSNGNSISLLTEHRHRGVAEHRGPVHCRGMLGPGDEIGFSQPDVSLARNGNAHESKSVCKFSATIWSAGCG